MPRKRHYWLVKSEPDVFSLEDLFAAPGKRTGWDGVRNYQARNLMRDEMKKGDGVLYYHSNTDPPGVAGTAEVVKEGNVFPMIPSGGPSSAMLIEPPKTQLEKPSGST